MIVFYRAVGFYLLVGCISSLFSLLARLVPEFREPIFYVVTLFCLICGATGMGIYYSKKEDSKDWIVSLYILVGFAITVVLGGAIQWSR